ncbi:MAG: ATP-binding protein [Actinobacteria bacterium]|nr:ATP-binding protein [Actinomycetota bacterium]
MIRELLVEFRVLPTLGSVSAVRREIEGALAPVVPAHRISDVVLVVSELCTNAIEAADAGACDVVVRVGVPSSRSVTIEVEDCGAGFELDEPSLPDEADESGRGLSIVNWVADDLEVERLPERTIVRALLCSDEALELARDLK